MEPWANSSKLLKDSVKETFYIRTFLFCAECFSVIMSKVERNQEFQGIRI